MIEDNREAGVEEGTETPKREGTGERRVEYTLPAGADQQTSQQKGVEEPEPRLGFFARFRKWLGLERRAPQHVDERNLTEQFLKLLRCLHAATKGAPEEAVAHIHARIEEIQRKPKKSWQDAYEIEMLMAHVIDDSTLEFELNRRLVEAERVLHDDVASFYQEFRKGDSGNLPPEPEKRRALYIRLLNDLQWRYTIKDLKNRHVRTTMVHSSYAFMITFVFGWVIVALFLANELPFADVVSACCASTLGACFSLQIGLRHLGQRTLDELRMASRRVHTVSRLTIGMGAGLVLYFALTCNFLSGAVFPDREAALTPERANDAADGILAEINLFRAKGDAAPELDELRDVIVTRLQLPRRHRTPLPSQIVDKADEFVPALKENSARVELQERVDDILRAASSDLASLVLLLLWAFVAGFSERLVPDLLRDRAEKASRAIRGQGEELKAPT